MIIRSIAVEADDPARWPFTIPAVAGLSRSAVRLTSDFVVLLGANGSGKSTLLEGVAQAYGLDVRGGHGERRYASSAPRGSLADALQLEITSEGAGAARRRAGFFLRAETAAGMLAFMHDSLVHGYGERPSYEVSHGESYLQVLDGRFGSPGLYLLDEAEGPLSFGNTLRLLERLRVVARARGSQVVYATHSPLVAAVPEAQLLQLTDEGIVETAWQDLDAVRMWRAFMARPELFFDDHPAARDPSSDGTSRGPA